MKIPTILFCNSDKNYKNIKYVVLGNFYSEKANLIYYKFIKYLLNYKLFY